MRDGAAPDEDVVDYRVARGLTAAVTLSCCECLHPLDLHDREGCNGYTVRIENLSGIRKCRCRRIPLG